MYPPKQNPPAGKLDAQDAVRLIDDLIKVRLRLDHSSGYQEQAELCEKIYLIKRDLTDYFLATDPRPGLYFNGPKD